jgi:hypothetical protein
VTGKVGRLGALEVTDAFLPDPASSSVAAVYLTIRNGGAARTWWECRRRQPSGPGQQPHRLRRLVGQDRDPIFVPWTRADARTSLLIDAQIAADESACRCSKVMAWPRPFRSLRRN